MLEFPTNPKIKERKFPKKKKRRRRKSDMYDLLVVLVQHVLVPQAAPPYIAAHIYT
jgi:hypothetical protein